MIDIQALKARFIDLAIRGKLVEQRPEEGTAADLLKEIEAEKAQLIKEKKLKKNKPLPPISEDEIPFEIPESWKWVRLRSICKKIVDGDHNPPAGINQSSDYLMLSAQNIGDGQLLNLDKVRYLDEQQFLIENERTKVEVGDLFLTIVGTLGRSCVYKGGYNICFQRSVCVLNTLIDTAFLKAVLDSAFIQNYMAANAKGTAQLGFYLQQVDNLVIPVPPLSEQQRIVEKLESVLSVLNSAEDSLNHSRSLAQKVREGILQLAIQGKLVEQRPEEGTAEELLKQIQAEKAQLIKDKKIKKDKPLPPIAEDEIPFEIPESWEWVRIGDVILEDKGGGTPDKGNADYWNGDIPWMSVKDFPKNGNPLVSDTRDHITSLGLANSSSNLIDTKAIVLCVRMALGKYAKLSKPVAINQDLRAIWLSNAISSEYFLNFYSTLTSTLEQSGKGTTVSGIKKEQLFNVPMPIPPLSEQQRIVARVEKIFSMLKVLERS